MSAERGGYGWWLPAGTRRDWTVSENIRLRAPDGAFSVQASTGPFPRAVRLADIADQRHERMTGLPGYQQLSRSSASAFGGRAAMRSVYRHDQGFAVTYLAAEDGVLLHLTASTLPDVARMLSPNPTEPERVEELLDAMAAGIEYHVVHEGGSDRRRIFKRSPASRSSTGWTGVYPDDWAFFADVSISHERFGHIVRSIMPVVGSGPALEGVFQALRNARQHDPAWAGYRWTKMLPLVRAGIEPEAAGNSPAARCMRAVLDGWCDRSDAVVVPFFRLPLINGVMTPQHGVECLASFGADVESTIIFVEQHGSDSEADWTPLFEVDDDIQLVPGMMRHA